MLLFVWLNCRIIHHFTKFFKIIYFHHHSYGIRIIRIPKGLKVLDQWRKYIDPVLVSFQPGIEIANFVTYYYCCYIN
jgi:hypothetical protein